MKPVELFRQWTEFEVMMNSKSLSQESKIAMGMEWIRSLPPKQLCTSSTLTYDIVVEAMQGRVTDLKEEIYGSTIGKTSTQTEVTQEGQEPTQSKKRPSKEPVQKNAGNRRGSKAVENLD